MVAGDAVGAAGGMRAEVAVARLAVMGRDLAAASDENLWAAWRHIGRSTPKGRVEEDRELLVVETGSILATFNPVFVKKVPRNAAALVRRAVDRDVTVILTANPKIRRVGRLIAAGRAAGLVEPQPLPGMAMPNLAASVRGRVAPDDLVIETVDEAAWSSYFTTLCTGFEVPPEMVAVLDDPRIAQGDDVAAFLGRAGGAPVATALAFVTGATVGVYNVSTAPAHRARGYGAAMTWAAMRWGQARGCQVAVLQASAKGRPVYERMGFVEVVAYVQLMVPE